MREQISRESQRIWNNIQANNNLADRDDDVKSQAVQFLAFLLAAKSDDSTKELDRKFSDTFPSACNALKELQKLCSSSPEGNTLEGNTLIDTLIRGIKDVYVDSLRKQKDSTWLSESIGQTITDFATASERTSPVKKLRASPLSGSNTVDFPQAANSSYSSLHSRRDGGYNRVTGSGSSLVFQ